MRKRRRLADKLTISVCAVLVAVSAFFYVPMDVKASSDISFSGTRDVTTTSAMYNIANVTSVSMGKYIADETLSDNAYYRLKFDSTLFCQTSSDIRPRNYYIVMDVGASDYIINYSAGPSVTSPVSEFSNSGTYIVFGKGSDLKNINLTFRCLGLVSEVSTITFDCSLNFTNVDVLVLTGSQSATYESGYNAGYSAGEHAGESNGYSNGYSDGFEAGEQSGYDSGFQSGQESVDTQSYYDMGYSAGYDVGYQSGYDEGYEEGYSKALKSVQGSAGQWGSPMFVGTPTEIKRYGQGFYVSSYGLVDMEEYQSGANGYFYNTVPGTYDGYTTISYNIPFYSFNNRLVKIDSDKFQVDFGLRDLDISVECDDGNGTELANLFESRLNEVYLVYNGRKYYGNYDIGTGYVEFDFIAEGVGNPTYLNTGSMTLFFNIHNTVTLVTDADVSHFISAKYHNVLECSLGIPSNSYAIYIRPYLVNDRVSANIQDQTNSLTNGFNDSQGNAVNNDFSSGLNDFETAEDSLFATATSGLKDFTFFDFQSVPAMVTGMSFVGSIMSGWFTQAGGASGVGIVLSILFSIMLVAMVLGLYRWYQSKGGKD